MIPSILHYPQGADEIRGTRIHVSSSPPGHSGFFSYRGYQHLIAWYVSTRIQFWRAPISEKKKGRVKSLTTATSNTHTYVLDGIYFPDIYSCIICMYHTAVHTYTNNIICNNLDYFILRKCFS